MADSTPQTPPVAQEPWVSNIPRRCWFARQNTRSRTILSVAVHMLRNSSACTSVFETALSIGLSCMFRWA